jgi:Transcriptional regulator
MPLTRVTIRQFEAFLAIVDLHSIGAAAERLGLTSSAVSQLLAELETELGFRLFDRTTRRVNLSSAGQDFCRRPNRCCAMCAPPPSPPTTSAIARPASCESARRWCSRRPRLPAAIAEYARDKPKVVVRICDTVVEQLVERVESGDVDLRSARIARAARGCVAIRPSRARG